MRMKALALAVPAAMIALPLALPAAAATGSQASSTTMTYQADLAPLNNSGASGHLMLKMSGNQATITEHVSGLAATFKGNPYPHVQHIHGLAMGTCPAMSADKNGDGIVDTTEGKPSYGAIQTTLSVKGDTSPAAGTNVKIAPSGSSFDYSRTISLNADTMKAIKNGNAVIVVHGLDPSGLSKKAQSEKSNLVPSLPLAATSPAACGKLTTSQAAAVPGGAAATGGGGTSGVEDPWLFGIGGAAILAAGSTMLLRRKRTSKQH